VDKNLRVSIKKKRWRRNREKDKRKREHVMMRGAMHTRKDLGYQLNHSKELQTRKQIEERMGIKGEERSERVAKSGEL